MTQHGPIEDKALPSRLRAHVVTTGYRPSLHGYDVQSDLARNYKHTDVIFTSLVGELPDDVVSEAFAVALTFVSTVTVAEAPAHAAVVARVCGPRASSMLSVAGTALAEQTRELLDEHAAILPKLLVGALNGSAATFAPRSSDERGAVERLRVALGGFVRRVPALGYDIRLDTAIIATLVACGLRDRELVEVAIVSARLPVVCAEALAWRPGALRDYPMDLPRFIYGDRNVDA